MARFPRGPARGRFVIAAAVLTSLLLATALPSAVADTPTAPSAGRDIVLALDASGSMHDEKFDAVKEAVHAILPALQEDDRFTVFAFSAPPDWWINAWNASLQPATEETRAAALAFVDGSGTSGNSHFVSALQYAFGRFESPAAREPIVVLITDGIPSSGMKSLERILPAVEKANGVGACIFTLAVGEDANLGLLEALAEANEGTSAFVEDAATATEGFRCTLPRPVREEPVVNATALAPAGAASPSPQGALPQQPAGPNLVAPAAPTPVVTLRPGVVELFAPLAFLVTLMTAAVASVLVGGRVRG